MWWSWGYQYCISLKYSHLVQYSLLCSHKIHDWLAWLALAIQDWIAFDFIALATGCVMGWVRGLDHVLYIYDVRNMSGFRLREYVCLTVITFYVATPCDDEHFIVSSLPRLASINNLTFSFSCKVQSIIILVICMWYLHDPLCIDWYVNVSRLTSNVSCLQKSVFVNMGIMQLI